MDWIRGSVEAKHWGMNPATWLFFITIFFTVSSCWGLTKQNRKIKESRSGKGVSVIMFSYFGSLFFAFLYWGFTIESVASVLNGVVGFFYLSIMWNLYKFKGFTPREKKIMVAFSFFLPLMIVVPWKDELMLVILAGSVLPMVHQVQVLWRTKMPGEVSMQYVGVFLSSTVFWTGYAYYSHNVPLLIINPVVIIVLLVIMFLWFKYRKNVTSGGRVLV